MNIVTKATGDSLTAGEFNQIPDELENVITSAGLSTSDTDLTQVAKSISQYVADGNLYEASGTANDIVLSAISPRTPIPTLTEGLKVRFKALYNNTGSTTVNINSLGVKNIVFNGNALSANQIVAGKTYILTYKSGTQTFELSKEENAMQIVNVSDFGDDEDAIRNAINYASEYSIIILPQGEISITSSLPLKKGLKIYGNNTKLVATGNISIFESSSSIWEGRILFNGIEFLGDNKQGSAINISNNTPNIYIENCLITQFNIGIILADAYTSDIKDCNILSCNTGILLRNSSHATCLINNFVSDCVNYGLKINDNSSTEGTHNISVIGGAYQGCQYGIHIERCYEPYIANVYFERNTINDIVFGTVATSDYTNGVNNAMIANTNHSSECSGANIICQGCVGANMQGLGFNNNGSTYYVEVNGYCDKILIDYQRIGSIATPFNLTGYAQYKTVIRNNGQTLMPYYNNKALEFYHPNGNSFISENNTSTSGRLGLNLISITQDLAIGAPDVIKFVDTSGGSTPSTWSEIAFFNLIGTFFQLNCPLTFKNAENAWGSTGASIIQANGAFCPTYLDDTDAPSNSIYYSKTQSTLVWKDKNNNIHKFTFS